MMRRTRNGLLAAAVLLVTAAAPPLQMASAGDAFKPFKLKAADGTTKSLPDVLGKATLIVFFFPTCGFCNVAFPALQKLHDRYKDEGLSMVWINVVPQQERLVQAWKTRHGCTVPVLLGSRATQSEYGLSMTPTHYMLDARGQVLARHAGYRPGDERLIEQRIQEALELNSH